MNHLKTNHKDVPPEDFVKMGEERKWKLRE